MREERETIINWSMADKTATVFTADPAVIRKLDKLCKEHPEVYRMIRHNERDGMKEYTAEARYIRFGKPASEAQREAARRNADFSHFSPRTTPEKMT